jgi:hypothetical protein
MPAEVMVSAVPRMFVVMILVIVMNDRRPIPIAWIVVVAGVTLVPRMARTDQDRSQQVPAGVYGFMGCEAAKLVLECRLELVTGLGRGRTQEQKSRGGARDC